MPEKIIMPKAGMAMEEGTIIRWLVQEGQSVAAGDPLLEIETDKVSMEVEATATGVLLKILAHAGDVVPVIQTIGYIGQPGEMIPDGIAPNAVQAVAKPMDVPAVNRTQAAATGVSVPSDSETNDQYDVIVVGGGPAGYVAAIKATQLGGRVALVEKQTVGGTCLNWGCVPTKTYLRSAELLHQIRTAASRGIHVDLQSIRFDMKEALANKNSVVRQLTNGVATLLKSNGVTVHAGEGQILDGHTVRVNEHTLTGGAVIFAGGSEPGTIAIPGIDAKRVLNSTQLLDIDHVPARLAIIGGGVIGVEMGLAFAHFGSQVTLVEMMDALVPNLDREVSTLLQKELEKQGLTIRTAVKLQEIKDNGDSLTLILDGGPVIEADYALLSIGRRPDLSGIAGLDVTLNRGRVQVNGKMETSIPGLYAPGDINGLSMLAHAAFKMGEIAAVNAMGGHETFKASEIPACVYSIPEIGSIGLTEEQARPIHDIAIGKFPFAANGRALASGEGVGFVKVISDRKFGEILGVHIIGPNAAEMINEASVLLKMEVTVDELATLVHGHPTYSEALMEAGAAAAGVCIHLPKK